MICFINYSVNSQQVSLLYYFVSDKITINLINLKLISHFYISNCNQLSYNRALIFLSEISKKTGKNICTIEIMYIYLHALEKYGLVA